MFKSQIVIEGSVRRGIALAVIAVLAGPTVLALAPTELRPLHPPIVIASDADLLLPTSGVRGGTGTASDPYVISGWTFEIPAYPLPPVVRLNDPGNAVFGIEVRGTTSHVVIRDNDFAAPGDVSSGTISPPLETPPGIRIHAPNVKVASNSFVAVGGFDGAVHVLGAPGAFLQNVVVESNSFRGGNRPAVYGSFAQLAIVGNDIRMESRNCCLRYGFVEIEHAADGTRVTDNTIMSFAGGALGAGGAGIRLAGAAGGSIAVQRNAIGGFAIGGIYVSGADVTITDNVVIAHSSFPCLDVPGQAGRVLRNHLTCDTDPTFGASILFADTNRLNGMPMVEVRGVADQTIDIGATYGPVAMLRIVDVSRVTLRGVDTTTRPHMVRVWEARDLVIEDSRFIARPDASTALLMDFAPNTCCLLTVRNVTLRNITATAGTSSAIAIFALGKIVLDDVRTEGGPNYGVRILMGAAPHEIEVVGSRFANATQGLRIYGLTGATVAADVTRSAFVGNGVGLEIASAGSARIAASTFEGNIDLGLKATRAMVDASGSWWGSSTGPHDPAGNPDGAGDGVAGATYVPWLTAPAP